MTEKPKIEDVISGVLNGEVLRNAQNFIAYLRENKINPQCSATNVWKISYQSFILSTGVPHEKNK